MSDARFEGRACLVTGGGRGIGRGAAVALASAGARVAVMSRSADECEEVARELGGDSFAVPCDVTDVDRCGEAVETIYDRFGALDVVVHAAGISPVRARAEDHDPRIFQNILDVNVAGAFNIVHAAARRLFETGGSVVFVASVLGVIASDRLAGYGASKAALVQLTRTLGREWARHGVRVNAVCPGYVPTALTERMLAAEHIRDELLGRIPLGRLATVDEVVAPVLFLASDAASYITGTSLLIDGGMAA